MQHNYFFLFLLIRWLVAFLFNGLVVSGLTENLQEMKVSITTLLETLLYIVTLVQVGLIILYFLVEQIDHQIPSS